jgi:hypothetical protein
MVEGHYFEIVTIVRFSIWNSTSSGFHYAFYLEWLQELNLLQYKDMRLQEIWLWLLDVQYCEHVLVSAQRCVNRRRTETEVDDVQQLYRYIER